MLNTSEQMWKPCLGRLNSQQTRVLFGTVNLIPLEWFHSILIQSYSILFYFAMEGTMSRILSIYVCSILLKVGIHDIQEGRFFAISGTEKFVAPVEQWRHRHDGNVISTAPFTGTPRKVRRV